MNDITTTKQPAGNALAQSDQQRSIAEVQAAMMIARANPRNVMEARDRILLSCERPGLAQAGMYTYARGGTDITGPSIRLAEAMAQAWGNISFGIRELEQRAGESVVQAFAWDVETNTRREMTFTVKHERHTRSGVKRLTDPRDIYEMAANQGARRLRACILGVIPGDIQEEAVTACESTLANEFSVTPEAIKSMLDRFAKWGVTKDQIEARIQRKVESMTPANLAGLFKIATSIKDGMSAPGDWFTEEKSAVAKTLNERVQEIAASSDSVESSTPAPDASAMTFAEVQERIDSSKDSDSLRMAADFIPAVADEAQRKELVDLVTKKAYSLESPGKKKPATK